ncbi:hypothetical protein P9112_009706 [Eukaryota sp. TZLM1-RC]
MKPPEPTMVDFGVSPLFLAIKPSNCEKSFVSFSLTALLSGNASFQELCSVSKLPLAQEPDELILQWYEEIHQHILVHWLNMTANTYIGGGENLFQNSIRKQRFASNLESVATIFQSGLNILPFLEDSCPDVMKRHSLSTVQLVSMVVQLD